MTSEATNGSSKAHGRIHQRFQIFLRGRVLTILQLLNLNQIIVIAALQVIVVELNRRTQTDSVQIEIAILRTVRM